MTIKLNSFGGGGTILMPVYKNDRLDLDIKIDAGSGVAHNVASFYTAIESDFTSIGFDTATLITVGNTLEQDIMDTGTGNSGVLTQVVSGTFGGAGQTMTIRVYIDGALDSTYTGSATSSNDVVAVGDFLPWAGEQASAPSSYGVGSNIGYGAITSQALLMLSPRDSLTRGLPIGKVFEDSLRVTVQSTAATAGSATNKAIACWLTSIPEGLV